MFHRKLHKKLEDIAEGNRLSSQSLEQLKLQVSELRTSQESMNEWKLTMEKNKKEIEKNLQSQFLRIIDEIGSLNNLLHVVQSLQSESFDKIQNVFCSMQAQANVERIVDGIGSLNDLLHEIQSFQLESLGKIQNMFWSTQGQGNIQMLQKQYWNAYPKATGDLRAVQLANLVLLENLREICRSIGIVMWASGGTLIGAIRHKGFIPWDDDVDVCMRRQDLDNLIKYLKGSEFFIREYFHDNTCSRGFQFCYSDNRIPNFIDIAVFDYCTCFSQKERELFLENFRIKRREMENDFYSILKAPKTYDVGLSGFGPYSPENREKVLQLFESYQDKLGRKSDGNCLFYGIDNYPFGYPVMSSQKLLNVSTVIFENIEIEIPGAPEEYLQGYGDIWQFPADMGKSQHIYAFQKSMSKIYAFLNNTAHTLK